MIQEQTLGPEHPAVGRTLLSYGRVLELLLRKREAKTANDRARRILAAHARTNHLDMTVDAAQLGT